MITWQPGDRRDRQTGERTIDRYIPVAAVGLDSVHAASISTADALMLLPWLNFVLTITLETFFLDEGVSISVRMLAGVVACTVLRAVSAGVSAISGRVGGEFSRCYSVFRNSGDSR